jgi:hypothetical protein
MASGDDGVGAVVGIAPHLLRADRRRNHPWDPHVAADAAICSILTLNLAKWRQPYTDLDAPDP